MRQLTGAVCIIATANGTDKAGLTATAVCSVSAQPPRLLVGVNRSGRSSGLIRSVGRFSVNVLADADQTLAARFARPSESSDSRFEQGHWRLGVLGVPVLGTALATFECRIEQIVDSGTHGILFGDVVAVHGGHSLAGPLLYANGQFCRLRDGRESILDSGW
ncbi:MAG: flavin reductase family protein [Pirellulaceae bacterium]